MSRLSPRAAVSVAVVVIAIVAVALLMTRSQDLPAAAALEPSLGPTATSPGAEPQIVRENSHVVGDPADGTVVVAEFLDFECEACGAWYPAIEQLRQRYAGQVRFVHRYFPLPDHRNALNAAVAAEAAAQQGAYERMYKRLFETQQQWGEAQDSKAELFRVYAEELGLDLVAYDAAVASEAVRERVQADVSDGVALGVQGTPTFYLDGELVRPNGPDDFAALIEGRLAGTP